MSLYILAEPQQQVIKQAYSGKFKQPHISYLFDNTEIPDLKQSGPILLSDPQADQHTLKEILQKNAGLLISSTYTREDILAQLRHNLFVYFKPDQIGIFRYYDPFIASYFFTSLNEQETANWLGPIATIEWYNTNWRDKATKTDQWQQKHNPMAKDWRLNPERLKNKPVLTNNQNLALQDMQEEKAAYYWFIENQTKLSQSEITIDTVIYWVKQGIKDTFENKQQLNQYLTLRAQYPKGTSPESWPTNDMAERLIYLEYYLAKTVI